MAPLISDTVTCGDVLENVTASATAQAEVTCDTPYKGSVTVSPTATAQAHARSGAVCWEAERLGIARTASRYFAPSREFSSPARASVASEPSAQERGVTILQAARLHRLPLAAARQIFFWGGLKVPAGRDGYGVAFADRNALKEALGPSAACTARPVPGHVERAEAKRAALLAKLRGRAHG